MFAIAADNCSAIQRAIDTAANAERICFGREIPELVDGDRALDCTDEAELDGLLRHCTSAASSRRKRIFTISCASHSLQLMYYNV